jgi:hypothetical protein
LSEVRHLANMLGELHVPRSPQDHPAQPCDGRLTVTQHNGAGWVTRPAIALAVVIPPDGPDYVDAVIEVDGGLHLAGEYGHVRGEDGYDIYAMSFEFADPDPGSDV